MSDNQSREDKIVEVFIDRHENTKAEGTVKSRKNHIKQFREWLRVEDISLLEVSRYDVEDHFDTIRGNHPDTYATARLDAVSAFYSWLQNGKDRLEEKHGITVERDDNPAEGILKEYEDIDFTPKKAKVYDHDIVALTREEAEKLVDRETVPEPKTRNQLLLKMMLQTGMRVSEIIEIEIGDLNRDQRRIRVRDQKNDRRRTVFYQPSLDSLLDRWLDKGLRATYAPAAESPYLFISYKHGQMSRSGVGKIVRQAAHNAGIQDDMYEDQAGRTHWKVTPHTLRHSYARFAVTGENKMDISRLAQLMGHRDKNGNPNIETTKQYLAFTEEDLMDASAACIPDV